MRAKMDIKNFFLITFFMSHMGVSAESRSPSAVSAIEKMSCIDCHKTFSQREKALKKINNFINKTQTSPHKKGREWNQASSPLLLKKKKTLTELTSLYRKQFALFNQQFPQGMLRNAKYKEIMDQVKELMDKLTKEETSLLLRIESANRCHHLFTSLEALLKENLEQEKQLVFLNDENDPRVPVIGIISGEVEREPHKKFRNPTPEEAMREGEVLVVPAALGKEHGLHKLLDIEIK